MPAARRSDPATSQAAAVIDPADLDALRARILRRFNARPKTGFTDEELVDEIQWGGLNRTAQRIRTARNDLSKLGLLKLSDEKRRTTSGYQARVWQRA
jgi:hypothetical protein